MLRIQIINELEDYELVKNMLRIHKINELEDYEKAAHLFSINELTSKFLYDTGFIFDFTKECYESSVIINDNKYTVDISQIKYDSKYYHLKIYNLTHNMYARSIDIESEELDYKTSKIMSLLIILSEYINLCEKNYKISKIADLVGENSYTFVTKRNSYCEVYNVNKEYYIHDNYPKQYFNELDINNFNRMYIIIENHINELKEEKEPKLSFTKFKENQIKQNETI